MAGATSSWGYRASWEVKPGRIPASSNIASQEETRPKRSDPAVPACFLPQPSKRRQKGRLSQRPGCSPVWTKELEGTLERLLGEQTTKPSSFNFTDLSPKLSVCKVFLENINTEYVPSLR